MLTKAAATRLFEYTAWANHRMLRAAATLSVDDFKRDLGGSYGGVRGTLAHILAAEWIWLERWKGVSPSRLLDEGEFGDVLVLRERWRAVEDHRDAWLRNLKGKAMAGVIRYNTTEGVPYESPLWRLVQHVANHSTYHRGQVTIFLRQLGAKPPTTDVVIWDRLRDARKLEANE
jgi:uncharacterized damage-inducible protein DinB